MRPRPDLAEKVAAVPYDTVDYAEALQLAEGNPVSFLHVGRSEIDLPAGTDPYSEAVYMKSAQNFSCLRTDGVMLQEETACLYIYRLTVGNHSQNGIACCFSVSDYESGVIRRHENTRKDKERDRTQHVRTLKGNAGPVFLTYRDNEQVDREVASIQASQPLYDFTAVDGVRHTLWRVMNPSRIVEIFRSVPLAYIADGHHRAAAAARVGVEKRNADAGHTGQEPYNWFLGVIFPANQLRIMPYNRCVKDLAGLSKERFIERLASRFTVRPGSGPKPSGPRRASMYLAGEWYELAWNPVAGADPVDSLDVSYLQNYLLDPVLGIKDPRSDSRIEFVGGIRGTAALQKMVDEGRGAVAFSMWPVTVAEMMAIADAGRIMPPKSTWFEPKLRSGVVVYVW